VGGGEGEGWNDGEAAGGGGGGGGTFAREGGEEKGPEVGVVGGRGGARKEGGRVELGELEE